MIVHEAIMVEGGIFVTSHWYLFFYGLLRAGGATAVDIASSPVLLFIIANKTC